MSASMSEEQDDGFKVAQEGAEAEFRRFGETMDLDFVTARMDDEDSKAFEKQKGIFIRAVRLGRLIVDQDGQPVYTPQMGDVKSITFYEPDGACIMAIDEAKKNHDVTKSFKVLRAVTKQSDGVFAKMKNRDLKVCQAVINLFLG